MNCLFKACKIFSYRGLKPHIKGIANERMAYAHFVEEGNLGLEVCQILQIQVVARIEPEANFLAGDSSTYNASAAHTKHGITYR